MTVIVQISGSSTSIRCVPTLTRSEQEQLALPVVFLISSFLHRCLIPVRASRRFTDRQLCTSILAVYGTNPKQRGERLKLDIVSAIQSTHSHSSVRC
jgi:hypothetical protein|eukprot:COSAG06_NODE_3093_length_5868_cov_3.851101_3_plen_97_part_00